MKNIIEVEISAINKTVLLTKFTIDGKRSDARVKKV